jgi:ribosomal protein L37AE/L43A
MMYPRHRNHHTDDGSLIRASNRRARCPNCGSDRYRETVSMESCDACGLRMDYWGGGANSVYEKHEARAHAREQAEKLAREQAWEREWQAERDSDWDSS